jgi:hypothetical protein
MHKTPWAKPVVAIVTGEMTAPQLGNYSILPQRQDFSVSRLKNNPYGRNLQALKGPSLKSGV